jgi:two-component system, sensor histidine kinase and response regulator
MTTKKSTILIVDDMTENLDFLYEILNKDFEIQVATNGKRALELLKDNEPPDLILLDIEMPEMDGYETIQQLKKNPKMKDLPVIFLTGKTKVEDIIKGFKIGGQDYIAKPFNTEELLARVNTHLDLKRKREELDQLNHMLEEKVLERTQQLRKANKELEQANLELQNLDYAKTNFLKIISHEIRTPLSGILGFTELLEDSLKSTEFQEDIDLIKQSALRLKNFSEKALLITEIQARKTSISKMQIPVIEIVETVTEGLNNAAVNKKITFSKSVIPDLSINVDPKYFQICLSNIVENAIKFSPENETIQILVKNSPDFTTIIVKDSGPGFSQKAQDNLFKFFSLGKDPVDQDFGLGLATSKLVLDAHSGNLNVENNSLKGATVTLQIPR